MATSNALDLPCYNQTPLTLFTHVFESVDEYIETLRIHPKLLARPLAESLQTHSGLHTPPLWLDPSDPSS